MVDKFAATPLTGIPVEIPVKEPAASFQPAASRACRLASTRLALMPICTLLGLLKANYLLKFGLLQEFCLVTSLGLDHVAIYSDSWLPDC